MKVLYTVTAFPRYEGDVICPWLVETIRRLRERGLEVHVFASSYKGIGDQRIYGVPVKRFRYFFKKWENLTHEETTPDRLKRGFLYKLLVPFYLIGGIIRIVWLCRDEAYDIIHVHWPFPHTLFGYLGKRVCGAKMVSSFHGLELRWVESRMPFFIPFIRWAIKESQVVTANSSYTAREVRRMAKAKVLVIPFGTTVGEDRSGGVNPRSGKKVLFVGRLVEGKGARYLLEAFDLVASKVKDARLTVVGEGPEREGLEEWVRIKGLQDKVSFTRKMVSREELERYYRDCDVFVLPAIVDSLGHVESLGVVLIEAMSYKKPVIASRVGGIVDVVRDGETGLLIPPGDPQRLAQAMVQILADEHLATRLGQKGYQYVQRHFNWDHIIDELIKVYEKLIPKKDLVR